MISFVRLIRNAVGRVQGCASRGARKRRADADPPALALELADVRRRLILDLLDEGVVLYHRELGLVEVNDAASRMLGVVAGGGATLDQIAPRIVAYELDGSQVDPQEMPSARALRTGSEDRRRELELRSVDGSASMFVEIDTVPTDFDGDGRATMALSTFRNVTNARDAAAALAISEQRFRMLADNTRDLVTLSDGAGGFAYVSPSVHAVLGYSPSDMIARRLVDVLRPEDIDRIRESTAVGDTVCHELIRSDGSRRWLETIAHDVADHVSGRSAVITSSRDVTDRVIAEQALLAERNLLDTCFAHLHSGVLAIDREGRVMHINQRHRDLWGLDMQPGEPLASLRARTTLLDGNGAVWSTERPFDLALAGVHLLDVAARIERIDGSQSDIVLSAMPLRSSDGAVTGAVMTMHDVTELRTAERELRELAGVDQLTGLPNRRRLLEHVEQAVNRCRRHPDRLLVCFIDLDGFKDVNDRFGHEAGDELLSQAATRISTAVRIGDFVARLGGDEFVVVTEDLPTIEDGPAMARRIEDAMLGPFELTTGAARVGASVGIRVMRAGDTPAMLLADADRAMYMHKSRRRDDNGVRPTAESGDVAGVASAI